MSNETCVMMGDFGMDLVEELAVLLSFIEDNLGMDEILAMHHPELCWAEKPYCYIVALCGEVKEFWSTCSIREGGYLEFDCTLGACWIEPIHGDEVESENIWGVARCGDQEYWEHWELGFYEPGIPMELLPF